MEQASSQLGPSLKSVLVRSSGEFERFITADQHFDGLIFLPDTFLIAHREMIVSLVAERKAPAIYTTRPFAIIGGLIAYGIDRVDIFRSVASYVDRILKGVRPAELPVQFPTKFKLVINVKTAYALGLDIPPMLLARADEVIE